MKSAQDYGTAEVWSAAQHRRTDDLAKWLGSTFKRNEKAPSTRRAAPRMASEEFTSYAYLAVALIGVGLLCSGLLALALV